MDRLGWWWVVLLLVKRLERMTGVETRKTACLVVDQERVVAVVRSWRVGSSSSEVEERTRAQAREKYPRSCKGSMGIIASRPCRKMVCLLPVGASRGECL